MTWIDAARPPRRWPGTDRDPATGPLAELVRGPVLPGSSTRRGRRPAVLAGAHPSYRPAEVVRTAMDVASKRGARVVVAIPEPMYPLSAWASTACGYSASIAVLPAEGFQDVLALTEQVAVEVLRGGEVPGRWSG